MASNTALLKAIEQKPCDHVTSPTATCSSCEMPEKPTGPLSRVWEPPPRPKPGRKPATDNPSNKRKAQNRQAQRNFRERRAQKISELEDLMEQKATDYTSEIDRLKKEVSRYIDMFHSSEKRYSELLDDYDKAVESRKAAEQQIKKLEQILLDTRGVVPLKPRSQTKENKLTLIHRGTPPASDDGDNEAEPIDHATNCSNCGPQNCACMESMVTTAYASNGNSAQSSAPVEEISKSTARERETTNNRSMEMEIDMTTHAKALRRVSSHDSIEDEDMLGNLSPPIEDCGFCDNGTVCPCRELRESAEQHKSYSQSNSQLKASRANLRTSGCSGDPGSCSQCQVDPMSKEFCVSFASHAKKTNVSRSGVAQLGCGTANCCRTRTFTSHIRSEGLQSALQSSNSDPAESEIPQEPRATFAHGGNCGGSSMDCATAYNRLKLHPHFNEAMANKEDWMRRLKPIPAVATASSATVSLPSPSTVGLTGAVLDGNRFEGRSAYEIDAASVMATFRHFDTRFGTDSRNDWKKEDVRQGK